MTGTVVRVVRARDSDLPAAIGYVAAAQSEPERHVTYVGLSADTISAEFEAVEAWSDRLLVAFSDDELAGVLLADIDADMRRVWWFGPWADGQDVALALLTEAQSRFGSLFVEEELAPDSRNDMVRSTAVELGFTEETPSSVLTKLDLTTVGTFSTSVLTPAGAEAVAELHDSVFPGTHTPGAKLVKATGRRIRTAQLDGVIAGYIAYEIHADGTGYIDYLGVRPGARRRGLARALIGDVCREFAGEGVPAVHLTVRADAPGAVDLYRSVGFEEDRIIVPYRSGFALG